MRTVENNDMIEAFVANGFNQSFDNAVLPRTRCSRHDLVDVETSQLLVDRSAVHSIAITDEVTRDIHFSDRLR